MSDVKMESKTYRKDFLEYEYQARSDVGQVRTNNEDSLIEAPDLGFFGVCDGLGGHAAGEVASGLASSTLTELVEKATLIAGGGFDYVILPRGGDELGAAAAVQGFPMRIVKARTVDAWALADCIRTPEKRGIPISRHSISFVVLSADAIFSIQGESGHGL